jgi:hypothetical protein
LGTVGARSLGKISMMELKLSLTSPVTNTDPMSPKIANPAESSGIFASGGAH